MSLTLLQRGPIGYAHADLRRRVAYRPRGGGPETVSRALPARTWFIVGPPDHPPGSTVRVAFTLDLYGAGDKVQIGARDISVEPEEGHPMTADRYRAVPLATVVSDAARRWSENTDGSEVTEAQARALLRPVGRAVSTGPHEEWERAASAYLAAKERGEPTGAAVVRALGRSNGPRGAAQARHIIRQARQHGLLPPIERG